MNTKTLAERAAEMVVTDLSIEHHDGETYMQSLGWALGNNVEHEIGMERFAQAVIDAQKAERFTPEAVVDAALDAYADNLYEDEERDFRKNVDAGNWRSLIIDVVRHDRGEA